MKRVSVQKYPKGGPLEIKWKHFINISFYLRRSYGILRMSFGDVGKGKDLLKSHICCGPSARLNIPKTHENSKLWVVFGVFAVKYTYFKPQNILIEANNILMISYTYEAKICRTTPGIESQCQLWPAITMMKLN